MEYSERLYAPLRWWVQGTMLTATFWLALLVAVPESEPAVWALTAVVIAIMAGALISMGTPVRVSDGVLRAGRAHIAVEHVGTIEPLDTERTRAVAGVEANARALMVMRPYLKRSVKIEITDPADPTPYWLVSTRRGAELTAALEAAKAATSATA